MKKRTLKILGIVLVLLLGIVFTFAKIKRVTPLAWGHKMVNRPMFSNEAVNGYDPVAYFTEGKAVPGLEAFSGHWGNAEWKFSSEENAALFLEDPEKYAPQFGGFCAFAISKGFTANSDPGAFEIVDGKLYLFADGGVKSDWNANQEENIRICEANWE